MAFALSKIKTKPIARSSTPPLWHRLSLRSLKGLSLGIAACIVVEFLLLLQPGYFRLRTLHEEKTHWQDVIKTGVAYSQTNIPVMDQLPDMIDQCRSVFVSKGVEVVSLNVERFGERRGTEKGARIDYALVRFRLLGRWPGIVTSLQALEKMEEVSFHVQEVLLADKGGEALLRINFCTGESQED